MELGTRPGPVTKIRYRWVCEKPVDLLLNLGTRSGRTIYRYAAGPMEPPMPNCSMGHQNPDLDFDDTGHFLQGALYTIAAMHLRK